MVAAPQNRIPVAVRPGAIIPMAPDMRNTSEKPWDPLTLEVFPSGKSEFTLYHDDGRSFAYEAGDFTVTRLSCEEADRAVAVLRLGVEQPLHADRVPDAVPPAAEPRLGRGGRRQAQGRLVLGQRGARALL